jgi:hypothetical protein
MAANVHLLLLVQLVSTMFDNAAAVQAASTPPCHHSKFWGDWEFSLTQPRAAFSTAPCDAAEIMESNHRVMITLRSPNVAHRWVKERVGGIGQSSVGGTFTTAGLTNAIEIRTDDKHTFFARSDNHTACEQRFTGTFHDGDANRGCFAAARRSSVSACAGRECHGMAASQTVGSGASTTKMVTRRLTLGRRSRRTMTLQPEPEMAPPALALLPANDVGDDVSAAAAINNATAGVVAWRAAASAAVRPLISQLRHMLGHTPMVPQEVVALTAARHPSPSSAQASSAQATLALVPSLDWTTHNGGGWLSPAVDMFGQASSLPGCAAATHVWAALAAVEARVRIATNRSQSERLSPLEVLACSPYSSGCDRQESAYVVGKFGFESGLERESCVETGATSTEDKDGESHVPQCATLRRCVASPRRRLRDVRFVGGHYNGGVDETALTRELQNGPVAVGLFVDASFALYAQGLYHPLERSYWKRMLGKTFPAFDLSLCHSGCQPPDLIEWQATNVGALLVGYGSDRHAGDYWILQLPWGRTWGEGGYARIVRGSDAAIAEAVVLEPMV